MLRWSRLSARDLADAYRYLAKARRVARGRPLIQAERSWRRNAGRAVAP